MELQQLRLLAAHVRGLLQQSNNDPGHNRSLDLIAAVPGLANWPEVIAFPERVAQAQLDLRAARRLAFRMERKFAHVTESTDLLMSLANVAGLKVSGAPELWPGGPVPGVYVTTSYDATRTVAESYTDATDGALMYVESAWSGSGNAIDLSEWGLWSLGLDRLPTGTLILLGPAKLDETYWQDSSDRIKRAASLAEAGHRVVVLVETPNPGQLFEDVRLLATRDGEEYNAWQLRGDVSDAGELRCRVPFATSRPKPAARQAMGDASAIPSEAVQILAPALLAVTYGILALGAEPTIDDTAMDLAAAALVLTDHVGPAARIMPRHRGTPSKDWDVPEAIARLPYLPSIESAVELGYKRLVIDPLYTKGEALIAHAGDVLFISRSYGADIDSLAMHFWRNTRTSRPEEIIQHIVAILGVVRFPSGTKHACDLYVRPKEGVPNIEAWREFEPFFAAHRVLKVEDYLGEMLSAGFTESDIRQLLPRSRRIKEHFVDSQPTNSK